MGEKREKKWQKLRMRHRHKTSQPRNGKQPLSRGPVATPLKERRGGFEGEEGRGA